MTISDVDRIRREDLLLFVNAGLTSTNQGGFYHGAETERISLAFLHEYIAVNYRYLYTLLLAGGLNSHNTAEAIYTLLSSGSQGERSRLEGALLEQAFRRLPAPQAYRLCERLAHGRVNNRRTRALIKSFLGSRRDLVFDAVKYRPKLKAAILHAHARVPAEVKQFLFNGARARRYLTPLLESYRKAHYDQRAVYELPFTIAHGLARRHGIEPSEFMNKIAPQMTKREKLRWQNSQAQDFQSGTLDLVELCLYFLRLPAPEREPLLPRLYDRARTLAEDPEFPVELRESRVAAVLDCSRSSLGSQKARRRPLAVALAVHLVLSKACRDYSSHWTASITSLCELQPRGFTCLGATLLRACKSKPQVVIVVSDGRENAPAGGCQAIADAWEKRLPEPAPFWVHFNPVFDPEDFQPLALGPHWPVVGIRRAEDLSTGFLMASYAKGRLPASELEDVMEQRALAFLAKSR